MDSIRKRHRHERADGAAILASKNYDLANLSLWPRDRAYVFVEDIGRGDDIAIRSRRVAIIGAEDIEDSLGALRGGKPRRDPRFDRIPVRPCKQSSWSGGDSGPDNKGELACRRHVGGISRDQCRVIAALADHLDQRAFRGAVVAEHVPCQVLDLSSAAG
jgi:hypothetical protein